MPRVVPNSGVGKLFVWCTILYNSNYAGIKNDKFCIVSNILTGFLLFSFQLHRSSTFLA